MISHSVTVMVVQLGAAEQLLPEHSPAREPIRLARETGKEALAELDLPAGLAAAAVLLGLVRIATARDGASRAVVGDLVYFCAMALLVVFGMTSRSAAIADATLLASLLGILATIALARIITRGRR